MATELMVDYIDSFDGCGAAEGWPGLCRSLLEARLVDRYRVVVFPVVSGATGADRMYDGWPDVALEVVETRTFDGKLQLFEFAPTVLDGPPAAPEPA